MQGTKGFIGIGGYKKRYLVKVGVLLLERHIVREVQPNNFGRYLSISSEIKDIFNIPQTDTLCHMTP
jgi:hypothetical protein